MLTALLVFVVFCATDTVREIFWLYLFLDICFVMRSLVPIATTEYHALFIWNQLAIASHHTIYSLWRLFKLSKTFLQYGRIKLMQLILQAFRCNFVYLILLSPMWCDLQERGETAAHLPVWIPLPHQILACI